MTSRCLGATAHPERPSRTIAVVARAAETDIAAHRVGGDRTPRGDPITMAVGRVTEIRTTFRDPMIATTGIVRIGPAGANLVESGEPVGTPLPHIPGHAVQAVTVGLVLIDRTCAEPTVLGGVVAGKDPLPHVHAVMPSWLQLVPPREQLSREATPGGAFPFCFGR